MDDRWYVLRDLARPNAKNPAYKQLQAMPEMKDCVFVPLKQHVFMEFGKRVVRSEVCPIASLMAATGTFWLLAILAQE